MTDFAPEVAKYPQK